MIKYVLLIILSILPFYKIFSVNFVDGHDFYIHFQKIYILEESIKNGIILPRFLPNATYGYGSPVFTYSWGIPYYIGALLHLAGVNYQTVFKILLILPAFLSVIGFFLWIRLKYSEFIAFCSTVIYLFAPYRFLNSFIRNALGELFFFAFLPFIFYFIDSVQSKKRIIFGSFFFALLIYSHQSLSVVASVIFLCYIIIQYSLKRNLLTLTNQLFILLGGFLLSAFYWLPALVYSSLLTTRSTIRFLPLMSLIRSKWEGGSVFNGETLIMSYQIGITQLMIILSANLYLFYLIIKKKNVDQLLIFWLFLFWISIFFTQPVSKWFWFNLPFIINLQFPFRLLFIPMTVAAVLSAFLLSKLKRQKYYIIGAILIIMSIIANRNHLSVQNKEIYLEELITYKDTYDVGGVLFPKYFILENIPKEDKKRTEYLDFTIINGKGNIIQQERNDYQSKTWVNMQTKGKLLIKRLYFPGWQVTINGKKTENFEKTTGIILDLPEGKFEIKVEYHEPILITLANLISILTLIIFLTQLISGYLSRLKFLAPKKAFFLLF